MCLTSYTLSCVMVAGNDLKSLNVKRLQSVPERILEHWRIRDGRGESLYPRSSFAIKLAGDVFAKETLFCLHKYEKMKASEDIMGRRTVAGKVVKESYGTAKHQHTFTIEVFWCEGMQKLPPLYPFTSERTESLWVTDLEAGELNECPQNALERKNRQSLHCSKIILDEAPDFVESVLDTVAGTKKKTTFKKKAFG
ncbi:hypothetical protein HID58_041026 [Brassica napus]|uniref:DUF7699 domain-containing protein n=1 Tax=Brassica napus TaxID=3708 RepID=A0ABQ8BAW0_BRANA|nr:hypothetical protein HID58_041026 [Brassica napus]